MSTKPNIDKKKSHDNDYYNEHNNKHGRHKRHRKASHETYSQMKKDRKGG